jgi:hypothetical protein
VRRIVDRGQPLLGAIAPNYHHLQHSGLAMIGEYLLSWAVTFERHVQRLKQIDQRLDYGPSTFGGRQQTNQLLDAVSAQLGLRLRQPRAPSNDDRVARRRFDNLRLCRLREVNGSEGSAGVALFMTTMASLCGSSVGIVVLALFAPPLASVALISGVFRAGRARHDGRSRADARLANQVFHLRHPWYVDWLGGN